MAADATSPGPKTPTSHQRPQTPRHGRSHLGRGTRSRAPFVPPTPRLGQLQSSRASRASNTVRLEKLTEIDSVFDQSLFVSRPFSAREADPANPCRDDLRKWLVAGSACLRTLLGSVKLIRNPRVPQISLAQSSVSFLLQYAGGGGGRLLGAREPTQSET